MTAIEERLPLMRLAAKASEPFDFAGVVRTHQAGVWRYVRFLGAEPSEADDGTLLVAFWTSTVHATWPAT